MKRDRKGKFVRTKTAMERFLSFCKLNPQTGCVEWTGYKMHAHGKTALYGRFYFEGKMWLAHRWAAKYIHGLEIDNMQVDHCCPNIHPNTICVHHLQAVTPMVNRELQWIRVQVGLLEAPPIYDPYDDPDAPPYYDMPGWMKTLGSFGHDTTDCPF